MEGPTTIHTREMWSRFIEISSAHWQKNINFLCAAAIIDRHACHINIPYTISWVLHHFWNKVLFFFFSSFSSFYYFSPLFNTSPPPIHPLLTPIWNLKKKHSFWKDSDQRIFKQKVDQEMIIISLCTTINGKLSSSKTYHYTEHVLTRHDHRNIWMCGILFGSHVGNLGI